MPSCKCLVTALLLSTVDAQFGRKRPEANAAKCRVLTSPGPAVFSHTRMVQKTLPYVVVFSIFRRCSGAAFSVFVIAHYGDGIACTTG